MMHQLVLCFSQLLHCDIAQVADLEIAGHALHSRAAYEVGNHDKLCYRSYVVVTHQTCDLIMKVAVCVLLLFLIHHLLIFAPFSRVEHEETFLLLARLVLCILLTFHSLLLLTTSIDELVYLFG